VKQVILLTGTSGAGKSTISAELASVYGADWIQEREVSRGLAAEQGFMRSRHWLQAAGIEEVAEQIAAASFRLVSESTKDLVVVDGVYDTKLHSRLEADAGVDSVVAEVTAPFELRAHRYAMRLGGVALGQARREVDYLDSIKTEAGAALLAERAAVSVVNDGQLNEAIDQILKVIQLPLQTNR